MGGQASTGGLLAGGVLYTSDDGSISIEGGPALGQINLRSSSNAWASARAQALSKVVDGLSYQYVRLANRTYPAFSALPTIAASDPDIIGGAVSPPAANEATATGVILTDLSTQPHAWAVRGRLPVPGGNFNSFGPTDASGTNYVNLVSAAAYDATKLVLDYNGVKQFKTPFVIDGLPHVMFGAAFDGTTYFVLVDDVVVFQTIDVAPLVPTPVAWTIFNGTAKNTWGSDLLYGFQQPPP